MAYPGRVDLAAWRNGDQEFEITFKDEVINVPLDITGWNFDLQVRAQPGQTGAALITLGTGTGLDIVDGEAGKLSVNFTKAQLEALPAITDPTKPQTFFYDITGDDPGGILNVLLEGKFIVHPGVTR